ncbi:MAG TPA: BlaI/MecI/CopY family transcriptional regulator [Chthonomonadaceae bacterium]|nr:BlaI/MecI/CopY family transcriptional regulator [Chthonomonadaceae bacterium]
METTQEKRRKYIGVGGDDVPSLGVLEGDILRLLWDAGEPQSSVQVYEAMHFSRRLEKREMQSPSTIAVTLSRMVEKGLLTVERRPRGGKGYYGPTRSRAEVVAAVMDDVSRRLTGQPLGYLLKRLHSNETAAHNDGLDDLVAELRRVEQEDCAPAPPENE